MKLFAFATLALALALGFTTPPAAASEGCYVCKSGSTGGCQQCPYGSKDSQEARKACEKRGCKIAGTKPCALPESSTLLTAALAR